MPYARTSVRTAVRRDRPNPHRRVARTFPECLRLAEHLRPYQGTAEDARGLFDDFFALQKCFFSHHFIGGEA